MTRQIQTPGAPQDTDITRDQLRAQLDALGITYTTRDTKPELQAKLDAAQSAPVAQIDPAVLATDVATDLETNYPELVKALYAQIHALEVENAELRAKVADREGSLVIAAKSAPVAQQLAGMRLTDEGYVVG